MSFLLRGCPSLVPAVLLAVVLTRQSLPGAAHRACGIPGRTRGSANLAGRGARGRRSATGSSPAASAGQSLIAQRPHRKKSTEPVSGVTRLDCGSGPIDTPRTFRAWSRSRAHASTVAPGQATRSWMPPADPGLRAPGPQGPGRSPRERAAREDLAGGRRSVPRAERLAARGRGGPRAAAAFEQPGGHHLDQARSWVRRGNAGRAERAVSSGQGLGEAVQDGGECERRRRAPRRGERQARGPAEGRRHILHGARRVRQADAGWPCRGADRTPRWP